VKTLTLIRHPACADGSYRSTPEGTWLPGEVRELADDRAAELLEDFPGAFSVTTEDDTEEAPFDAAEIMDGPVRSVLPRLRALESRSALVACLEYETAGKARATVIDLITSRLEG
jgi:hypothetical protein